jgi:hypothetical protein
LARLASATGLLEQRRDRVLELTAMVDALAQFDVIVVDGERTVLRTLAQELSKAREALVTFAKDLEDLAALDRFEALVGPETWSVLDELERLLAAKALVAEQARREVQAELAKWADISARITKALQEIQDRHLLVVEPRPLAASRNRLGALLRQANSGYKQNQLLDAWRALLELREPQAVPSTSVADHLDALIEQARASSGRLQLTALRGPLNHDRFEYTLMLLTPTGDRHIGVNVQDSSTIVRGDREYFLREADAANEDSYRVLRAAPRDGAPPARLADNDDETARRLRDMGVVLYRLLIPDRMKEEMDRHPATPITIITNDLELPWELMFSEDFLALDRPMARMPVGRSRARRTPPSEAIPHRRRVALIASAGPDNELHGCVNEVQTIADRLRSTWGDEVSVDMYVSGTDSAPTGARFRTLLMSSDYDIIHYAGHAVFDRERPDQSGLILDGAEVCFAQKIQRLLQGSPLVFLNACESARLREANDRPVPDGAYEGDPKEGLASAFVYGGALACIGTLWPVLDTEAPEFAIAFYNAVLDGHPIGEAMLIARRTAAETFPCNPSWASFVLYGDPTFSLGPPVRLDNPHSAL